MLLRHYHQVFAVFLFGSLIFLFVFLFATELQSIKQHELKVNPQKFQQQGLIVNFQKKVDTTTAHVPTRTEKLQKLLQCRDRELFHEKIQYGNYWLLRNIIIGEKSKNIKCTESITYTTNGDYTFFDSLPFVIKSWLAPVSFALFAPGYDINRTMESIQYLRNCIPESALIRDFVTFHIYFPNKYMPKHVPFDENEARAWNYTCNEPPPFENVKREDLYKTKAKLNYPINVGRNIARKSVNTYFIFPCDIELIPSPKLVTQFLDMIENNISVLHGNNDLRVFPLPVFEIEANATIPRSKKELKQMLAKKTAIPFHATVCEFCHVVPKQDRWLNTTDTADQLSIVAVGKRQGTFRFWEPFYISNNKEPIFDERVTWEGRSNKRIQDFRLHTLDTAIRQLYHCHSSIILQRLLNMSCLNMGNGKPKDAL